MTKSKLPYKTNRQVLRKLVEQADDMTLVFIRERLLYVCGMYEDLDKVKKAWEKGGAANFINPSIYVDAAKEVKKYIDFDEPALGAKRPQTTPKSIKELQEKYPKLYEEFLRSNLKYGQTFKEFVQEFFGKR